jgi:hypothetical protein
LKTINPYLLYNPDNHKNRVSIGFPKNISVKCKFFRQVFLPDFSRRNVLYTYLEGKTGTPAFQKTVAKEIKNL